MAALGSRHKSATLKSDIRLAENHATTNRSVTVSTELQRCSQSSSTDRPTDNLSDYISSRYFPNIFSQLLFDIYSSTSCCSLSLCWAILLLSIHAANWRRRNDVNRHNSLRAAINADTTRELPIYYQNATTSLEVWFNVPLSLRDVLSCVFLAWLTRSKSGNRASDNIFI